MTRIAILGAGNVGKALAELARRAGCDVRFVMRSGTAPDGYMDFEEITAFADVFLLAVPHAALDHILPALRKATSGTVVIDATNPVAADWSPLSLAAGQSGAETIANALPEAIIVKAFNTVFADNMNPDRLVRSTGPMSTFICSDDADAAQVVAELAAQMGFDPVITGALIHARHVEAIAHLNIALLAGNSMNTRAAFLYDRGENRA